MTWNMVDIFKNTHNRHPIARPWGRDMGCLLWVQSGWCSHFREYEWCLLWHGQYFPKYSQRTPHSSPGELWVSFVSFKPGVCSTSVIVMLHSILCNILPHYVSIGLYLEFYTKFFNAFIIIWFGFMDSLYPICKTYGWWFQVCNHKDCSSMEQLYLIVQSDLNIKSACWLDV